MTKAESLEPWLQSPAYAQLTDCPARLIRSRQIPSSNSPHFQISPRLRKSPMFPPAERSIMSMVNLSRQTSHASSTP